MIMQHQLSEDLKPQAEQIARELAATEEVARELPFGDEGGKLWVSKERNDIIVLHTVDVDGVTIYIGPKVE